MEAGKRKRGRPAKKGSGILGTVGSVIDSLIGLGKKRKTHRRAGGPHELGGFSLFDPTFGLGKKKKAGTAHTIAGKRAAAHTKAEMKKLATRVRKEERKVATEVKRARRDLEKAAKTLSKIIKH